MSVVVSQLWTQIIEENTYVNLRPYLARAFLKRRLNGASIPWVEKKCLSSAESTTLSRGNLDRVWPPFDSHP